MASDSANKYLARFKKKQLKNSKNYGGAAVFEYKSKYIAKYIRNTLLSCKQTLKKTAFDSNGKSETPTYCVVLSCIYLRDPFAMPTSLKQFIHLKWLFNILYPVSRSYLVISSQIKHWFFLYFENSDRHIFPQKKYRTRSERLRLILRSFLTLASLDVTF